MPSVGRTTSYTLPAKSMVRSRAPSNVHSFAEPSSDPLTKRAPPGSTATDQALSVCAFQMVRSHLRRATR